MNSHDDFARDRHGNLIRDRYGRPVRSRNSRGDATPAAPQSSQPPRHGTTQTRFFPGHPTGTAQPSRPAREQHHQAARVGAPPEYHREIRQPGPRPVPHTGQHHGGAPAPQLLHTPRKPRTPQKPHKQRPQRPRFLRILAFILVALLVMGTGTAIWIDTKLQRTEAIQDYAGRVSDTAGTNWLLVGSDSRAGMTAEDAHRLMAGELNDGVGRTDTIMIVHLPTFGGETTMLSLPRDSWVTIPGHGEDKLNAAFALGGPALLQQTVEQATGLRIDRYAEIGFGGFANVVDAVGGIEMCLDEPLQDPMAGIDLAAGCQKLDGPTALGYVRSRYTSAGGDIDRIDRQKAFLAALSDKITSFWTLANPFRMFPLMSTLADSLTVNEKDHVWNLARLGMGIAGGAKQESVPVGAYIDTWAGNALVWDDAAAETMFAELR